MFNPLFANAEDANCDSNGECTFSYFGTAEGNPTLQLWADGDYGDNQLTRIIVNALPGTLGRLVAVDADGNFKGEVQISEYKDYIFSDPPEAIYLEVESGELWVEQAWTNNPGHTHITFDPSPNADDGGGSGGDTGGGGSDCIGCGVFSCPGWEDYMGELDAIRTAIPPAPNWQQVSETFRDTIVPRMINDLGNLLGEAPTPPPDPPQLPELDDRGISDEIPVMNNIPGLDAAQFDSDDIKDEAPVIHFREDPTGGFNLMQDPVDSLPDFPTNNFPVPGQTDAGEWGRNTPDIPYNPFPDSPEDSGSVEIGTPPAPGDSGATPPMPGDDTGTPPVPGDNTGSPPSPGDIDISGTEYYKPSP